MTSNEVPVSDQGSVILREIERYYSHDDDATCVDISLLTERIQRKYPKHSDLLVRLLEDVPEDLSEGNYIEEMVTQKREQVSLELASLLANNPTHKQIPRLIEQLQECGDINEETSNKNTDARGYEVFRSDSVENIVDMFTGANRLKLYPPALNSRTDGGVCRGHHILIYARPEVGKSLISINLAYGFLKQGLTVLYVGNEDPPATMVARMVSRLSNMSYIDVMNDPRGAHEKAQENGYDNFIFAMLHPGTMPELRELVEEYEPDVLIVDQLRNLHMGNLSKVDALEEAAKAVRRMAQEYNLVSVSVTQAGDSANGKLELDMGDVDYSNTGIPSQVDLMIGVGMNGEYEGQGKRMVSLPKNKVSGDHSSFIINVNPKMNRIE